jgi:hypothetical protein
MDTPRIRLSHAKGETPPNTYADFDWVRRNEKQLLEQYGEGITQFSSRDWNRNADYGVSP